MIFFIVEKLILLKIFFNFPICNHVLFNENLFPAPKSKAWKYEFILKSKKF